MINLFLEELTSNTLANISSIFSIKIADFSLAQVFGYTFSYSPDRKIILTSFLLSVVFLFFLIILIMKIVNLRKSKVDDLVGPVVLPQESGAGPLTRRWEEILRHANSPKEVEWKFAIIEADKLVDNLLVKIGYQGESMGERLLGLDTSKLVTLNGLWEAHKTRNKIVHDTEYFLRNAEARRVVGLYEKTLRELQAIN